MWEWISLAIAAVAFVLAMAAMGLLWRRQQCGGRLKRSGAASFGDDLQIGSTWKIPVEGSSSTVSIGVVPGDAAFRKAVVGGQSYTFQNVITPQDFAITPPIRDEHSFGRIVEPNTIYLYESDSSATPSAIMVRVQN